MLYTWIPQSYNEATYAPTSFRALFDFLTFTKLPLFPLTMSFMPFIMVFHRYISSQFVRNAVDTISCVCHIADERRTAP